jgi:hypothetical protein
VGVAARLKRSLEKLERAHELRFRYNSRQAVFMCRDALVHVSYQDAAKILANFAATGAKWLLLNTYPEVTRNRNQFNGHRWRRLNFRLEPFGFPEPVELMPDGGDVDPSQLAVWPLKERSC